MSNQLVYQFPRNPNEEVCISIREYKQRKYIDLRIFYRQEGSDELRPTKKGLTVGLQFFPELKKGLDAFEKELGNTETRPTNSTLQKGAKSV